MTKPGSKSPKFARRLVELCTPRAARHWLVGDMEETFARLQATAGEDAARRWYWRQSLSCVARMPRERWLARPGRRLARSIAAFGADLVFAARALRKQPGFALPAITVFAVGVGANAIVFTFVDAVLLRPLPYDNAQELVVLWDRVDMMGQKNLRMPISYNHFEHWRGQTGLFQGIAAFDTASVVVTTANGNRRISAYHVSAGWTDVLGVSPQLGREFLPEDDEPGAPPVVIVSDRYWRANLMADPGVIGTEVDIVGVPTTIVGVMPADFWFYDPYMFTRSSGAREAAYPDLWLPLHHRDWEFMPEYPVLRLLGRLAPEATLEEARGAASAMRASLPSFEAHDAATVELVALSEDVRAPVRSQLVMLAGAVLAVLLIVCVNLTSLTVTRATARQNELAVRAALGAGRARIARLVVAENTIVGIISGTLGAALAAATLSTIVAIAPRALPLASHIRLDERAIFFTLIVALAGSLAGSLAPIARLWQDNLPSQLVRSAASTSGAGGGRLRAVLVAAEVAITVTLLVAAALMLRTVMDLRGVDKGFDPNSALTFQSVRWHGPGQEPNTEFYGNLLREIRSLPGVVGAGGTSHLPFTEWGGPRAEIVVGDASPAETSPSERAETHWITDGFLEAAGIRLREGTDLPLDSGTPAALVNQAFVATYLDGQALGTSFGIVRRGDTIEVTTYEIVGVVDSVRQRQVDETPQPRVYRAAPDTLPFMQFVVRTQGPPAQLASAIREAGRRVDPDQPLEKFSTWAFLIDQSMSAERFYSTLLAGFGAVALLIAAIGVYGTVSYSVRVRLPEFGIRKALGAGGGNVASLVMRAGLMPVFMGILAGVAGAAATTRALGALLHGTSPLDVTSFLAALALFTAVGVLAVVPSAARAARLDPIRVLRAD